jgi:hypothetical protein
VALILREHDYDAWVIAGGLKAWQKAGFPVEPILAADFVQLPRFR